jgi:hypothetical protein
MTPAGANLVEPGNISPDGRYLVFTSDIGLDPSHAAGADQWLLDLQTQALTNLTRSPTEWDEHGMFAPNSKKVVFMSSHPYPDYNALTAPLWGLTTLKTEFMLVDIDGTNLRQLTHFNETGYPESTTERTVAAVAQFTPDGSQLIAQQALSGQDFPSVVSWLITFAGRCGGDGG